MDDSIIFQELVFTLLQVDQKQSAHTRFPFDLEQLTLEQIEEEEKYKKLRTPSSHPEKKSQILSDSELVSALEKVRASGKYQRKTPGSFHPVYKKNSF